MASQLLAGQGYPAAPVSGACEQFIPSTRLQTFDQFSGDRAAAPFLRILHCFKQNLFNSRGMCFFKAQHLSDQCSLRDVFRSESRQAALRIGAVKATVVKSDAIERS